MKKILIASLVLFAGMLFASNGEKIFKDKCISCHQVNTPGMMHKPGSPEFVKAIEAIKAPPMVKISSMIKAKYADKDAFVNFVSSYITKPDASKTVCMKKAIEGFGLMPAVGASMSDADKKSVAEWIYTLKASEAMKSMKCGAGKCGGGKAPKAMKKTDMKCQAGKCGSK